jgi:hypothetical protein
MNENRFKDIHRLFDPIERIEIYYNTGICLHLFLIEKKYNTWNVFRVQLYKNVFKT